MTDDRVGCGCHPWGVFNAKSYVVSFSPAKDLNIRLVLKKIVVNTKETPKIDDV